MERALARALNGSRNTPFRRKADVTVPQWRRTFTTTRQLRDEDGDDKPDEVFTGKSAAPTSDQGSFREKLRQSTESRDAVLKERLAFIMQDEVKDNRFRKAKKDEEYRWSEETFDDFDNEDETEVEQQMRTVTMPYRTQVESGLNMSKFHEEQAAEVGEEDSSTNASERISMRLEDAYEHGMVDDASAMLDGDEEPFDDSFPPDVKYQNDEMGFMAEGVDEEQLPDDEFYGDDISTIAHTELETHREMREYARLITWDLPLLRSLAKSFKPPSLEQPLRFRYTTYLGEEHPAANKVTCEFNPEDLPDLTDTQRDKLIKLCGPRYHPGKEVVKISCEMFDTQLQNKRWILDTTNALIKEAKDAKDTFADVPFDFRHYKPKPVYEFPKEWILTEARKETLAAKWRKASEAEQQMKQQNTLVDGHARVRNHHAALGGAVPLQGPSGSPLALPESEVPDMVMAELTAQNNYKGRRRFVRK